VYGRTAETGERALIRTWPLLFLLALVGCYSDQEQRLNVCQREADGKIYSTHPDIQEKEWANSIEVCMRAGGYELIEDSCPTSIRTGSIVPHYEEIGKKLKAAVEAMQRVEPVCYEPIGSSGKRLLWLEQKLGTAPRN
jgi:hypothetical protein